MILRAKTTGFHVCITIPRSHLRFWNLQLNLRWSRWNPTQRTPTSGRSTQALHPHLVADGGAVVLVVAVPRPVSMRAVHHLQPPVPEACLPEQGKRCRLVMLVEPSHDRMDGHQNLHQNASRWRVTVSVRPTHCSASPSLFPPSPMVIYAGPHGFALLSYALVCTKAINSDLFCWIKSLILTRRKKKAHEALIGMDVACKDDIRASSVEQRLHGLPHALPLPLMRQIGVVPRRMEERD